MIRVVVMGVTGCGKSTVRAAPAARLGVPYTEGASVVWVIYDGSRQAARTAMDLSKELKGHAR